MCCFCVYTQKLSVVKVLMVVVIYTSVPFQHLATQQSLFLSLNHLSHPLVGVKLVMYVSQPGVCAYCTFIRTCVFCFHKTIVLRKYMSFFLFTDFDSFIVVRNYSIFCIVQSQLMTC